MKNHKKIIKYINIKKKNKNKIIKFHKRISKIIKYINQKK